MRISEIIKTLAIIWFTETLISCILYFTIEMFTQNINIRPILLLKTFHAFYYYPPLLIIYYCREKEFSVKFFCYTNTIIFISISIVISLILKHMSDLFFDYTFVCNLLGIILAPILLKRINLKLPEHLRIY
jgi:hypothetical protein